MPSRRTLVLLASPIVAVLVVVAAWAIDVGLNGGDVLRNVTVAGQDVGGLGADEVRQRVEAITEQTAGRTVRIRTPEVTYETTAEAIGLTVDTAATTEVALERGRTGFVALRPVRWASSFIRPLETGLRYELDVEAARRELRRLEGESLQAPVEPTIESIDGDPFGPVPGQAGLGIDPETLAVALPEAARRAESDGVVEVAVVQSALSPRLPDGVAAEAAEEANRATSSTLTVRAGDRAIQLVPRELRRLATAVEGVDGIAIELSTEALDPVLDADFADLATEPRSASFRVEGASVILEPAVTGVSCCGPEAAEAVAAAFADGEDEVEIPLDEVEPELTTAEAEALGIVEEVGEPTAFGPTTQHPCCANRVTNIHRIADIIRGAIIPPGATFSINDFVGRRTVEGGFVTDGVIYDGVLTQDVGGGVSQFATTLFNAALFAGLEFGEYQSHSLYISRYPRGREATISFPAPDLQIRNPTSYGVLIWPEYTDTSITVRLFSTRHIQVAIGEPASRPQGNCTRWTTPRTRTYADGKTVRDSVFALYRPAEGVRC